MAPDEQRLLMASDAGYGFVCTFNDLVARNRAGKAMITLPDNAKALAPIMIERDDDLLMAITAAGRVLLFPVSDLPQLSKGKGNKIIAISSADFAAGKDRLALLLVVWPQATVKLYSGKRKIVVRASEHHGERGRKGTLLRGLQNIDRIEVDAPPAPKGDSEE